MSSASRRAALAALSLLASALTIPLLAEPAHAATPVETQFVIADRDHDGSFGLYRHPSSSGSLTPVVAESPSLDVSAVTASRDGCRFAEVETSYDAGFNPLRTRLVLYDVSGRLVRVVADVAAGSTYLFGPALSPDGNQVVWSSYTQSTGALSLLRAAAAGGASSDLGSGYGGAVFLDPTTVLAGDLSGSWWTMPAAGGPRAAVTGLPAGATGVVVSADGSQAAWSVDTTTGDISTADLETAPVTLSGGVASLGTAVTVTTGHHDTRPAFKRGGANLVFVRDDGQGGPGGLYTAQVNGSTPDGAPGADVGADVLGQAIGVTDDGTAPGPVTVAPATLSGSSAALHWALPADTDLSGVMVTRSPGSPTAAFVPAPATSFTDTGLALGTTYTYTLTAVDRSGNLAAGASHQLTAAAAAPSFADPVSSRSAKAPFAVSFGPAGPASIRYVVTYRRTTSSSFQAWVNGVSGSARTFGAPAADGVVATTSAPGATYQFRVQATDSFGNATAVVTSGRAVVPLDQAKAAFSGGTTRANSSAWLGSYRQLTVAGSYARISVTGDRFQVIGWRCPSCGVLDVYEGSRRIASIDSRAASTQVRQVLYTRLWGTVGARTMTIKARGTSGRPSVLLDGFAVRR